MEESEECLRGRRRLADGLGIIVVEDGCREEDGRAVVACLLFFQAEDGIRDIGVTGVQTCALPILASGASSGVSFALLASTEWPGVEPPDVEHGNIEDLVAAYPDFREQIRAFTS